MKLFNDKKMYNKKLNEFELILEIIKPISIYFIVSIIITIMAFIYGFINGNMALVGGKPSLDFYYNNLMLVNVISQLISLAIICLIYKKDNSSYPIVKEKIKKNIFIYGGLLILVTGIISGYLMELINYINPSFSSGFESVSKAMDSSNFIIVFVSTCILAPILEEIIFRGLVLNNLLSKRSILYSIVLSSLLFGLIHMNMLQGVNAFILGLSLAVVYIKTRNIYICMLGHFLNNLFSIIAEYSNLSILTIDVINIIVIILCIYPIIKFVKTDCIKIDKFEVKTNDDNL